MKKSYTTRKTPEQWQSLVTQQKKSGQTARKFCTEQNISYASFCQWRKRLAENEPRHKPALSAEPSFIDLSALGTDGTRQEGGWHIVLSLGNGVELRLSQG